jgi:hypothetical protein
MCKIIQILSEKRVWRSVEERFNFHVGKKGDNMIQLTCFLFGLVMSLCLGACGPPVSQYVSAPAAAPNDPNVARVFFVRPGRAGGNNGMVTVWDSETLIGKVHGNQKFVAYLPAGNHRLVALSDNADVVEASFEKGKTYYVYLWYTDFMVGSTVHINPLPPNSKHWNDKDGWMNRSRWVELIPNNKNSLETKFRPKIRDALNRFDPNSENAKRRIETHYGI